MNKEELIMIMRNLSAIEGYLMGVDAKHVGGVFESYIDPTVELINKKLKEVDDYD